MIRITVDDAGVQLCRADHEAVAGLFRVAAEAVDFGDERGQPVRLVAAQVRDAGQLLRPGGQGAEGRHGRGELAGFVKTRALCPRPAGAGRAHARPV